MTATILVDTREQKREYIINKFKSHGGITPIETCLSHGMDYLIMGDCGSVGIQRKSGASEIPQQMGDLRDDILPALKELTETPVLLIEEDFSIGGDGTFYQRRNGMLYPTGMNTKAYFNFIHSCKLAGVDVVTTRNLDASIWWMIATAGYLEKNHYPKMKMQYSSDSRAIGMLCCINGIGPHKAEKILEEYSMVELLKKPGADLVREKLLTLNQALSNDKVVNAKRQK